jgi:predicted secreted hydrolase
VKHWLVLGAALLLAGCEPQPPQPAPLDIQRILGASAAAGFLRATAPRALQFPADHGPHFGYRDEWWYVTGNLRAEDGRRVGFQLTFFRHQLRPAGADSGWQAPQVYMAHFAITDIDGDSYHFFERFGRPAAGIAGARAQPFAVWLDDWRLASAGAAFAPLVLEARAGALQLRLQLTPTLAPVAQGDGGLSRKSAEPGTASYYYSLPRIDARGTVRDAGGRSHTVRGLAWLDREWSTSALSADQVGWDWFSLQLRDGRALMVYQLRRRDGAPDPFSYGALIAADGSSRRLSAAQVELLPEVFWKSPTGARYPIRWRLRIPSAAIDWRIDAALPQQWFNGSFRYWEGAVGVTATAGAAALGSGYLEMTGY